MTLEERFWSKVDRQPVGCWTWRSMVRGQRYGRFHVAGRKVLAHRLAYELLIGPIPDGLDLCHTCDNDACVRPDHLFPATHEVNMRDAAAKGRVARGERVTRSKLTSDQVSEIRARRLAGEGVVALGIAFGVHNSVISRVARGVAWAHVPKEDYFA